MFGRRSLQILGVAFILVAPSCVSPGEGLSPPANEMYFPVGLAVSPGGHTLYVVNSDFDLQFNAGTVLALDLDRIRNLIPPLWDPSDPRYPCDGRPLNSQRLLFPGTCGAISLNNPPDGLGSLVAASTQIGAFATDILAVSRPDAPQVRLFIPVRGDPSLTWIDVEDDRGLQPPFPRILWCGQTEDSPRCDAQHRAGEDPDTNLRRAVLPPEPFGVAATELGDALVVTHQTTGAVSLVTNPWDGVPTLQFVRGGFPLGAVGIAAMPKPLYVDAAGLDYQPGFLTTFRAAAEVDLVRYYDDRAAAPSRPFITRDKWVGITVNASGIDSRGIAIDVSARQTCEAGCDSDLDCLAACAATPAQVYIANRAPPSLVVGETRATVSATGSDDLITIYDSVPLAFGASQVNIGNIIDTNGEPQRRVFVSCFDARFVFTYDPVGRRIDGQIRTGRGPHDLAFDPVMPLLYVDHFTDSYIGVVDLDQRHASTYGTIVATLGNPQPPRESK